MGSTARSFGHVLPRVCAGESTASASIGRVFSALCDVMLDKCFPLGCFGWQPVFEDNLAVESGKIWAETRFASVNALVLFGLALHGPPC